MSTLAEQLKVLEEQQKHALALEEQKWGFKQKELIFLEAGQHMRALNQLMWQAPTMAIAVTGGLWYGAATIEADAARAWVFFFASVVDCLTIATLFRLRELIGNQIDTQEVLAGPAPATKLPKNFVIRCWTVALAIAAAIGVVGAFKSDSFKKPAERATPPIVNAVCTQSSGLSLQPTVNGDPTPQGKQ